MVHVYMTMLSATHRQGLQVRELQCVLLLYTCKNIIKTKHKTESVVQVVTTLELVCIANGNIEKYNHDKYIYITVPQKLNTELLYDPTTLYLNIIKEIKKHVSKRYLYMYIAIILFPVAKGIVTWGPSVCECKQNVISPYNDVFHSIKKETHSDTLQPA